MNPTQAEIKKDIAEYIELKGGYEELKSLDGKIKRRKKHETTS